MLNPTVCPGAAVGPETPVSRAATPCPIAAAVALWDVRIPVPSRAAQAWALHLDPARARLLVGGCTLFRRKRGAPLRPDECESGGFARFPAGTAIRCGSAIVPPH